MNYIKLIILSALFLKIIACNKEKPAALGETKVYDTCLLTSIIEDGKRILDLEYADNKLIKANTKAIEYSENGFIKDCEFSREKLITYRRFGEIYIRKEATGGPAHTTVYYQHYYKYNSEGKLV